MSIKTRILAGISALTMAFSLSACSNADTTWANKVDGNKMNAGVYIFYTIQGYNDATDKLSEDSSVTKKNIMSKKIDDKKVPEYIEEYATNKCKEMIGVDHKFKELGLELSSKDHKAIKLATDNAWESSGDEYEKNGISKDSIEKIFTTNQKLELIFNKYYEKGGLEEVKQEDINKEINNKYARVKLLPLILKKDDGSELDTAGKEEVKKKAEEYIKKIKAGENFDKLINEYYENRYNASTGIPQSSLETDKETDPYENEQIVYDGVQYVDPVGVTDMVKQVKYNEPIMVITTTYIYVYVKLDIIQRDDFMKEARSSTLKSLKNVDFEKMSKTWGSNLKVVKNNDSYDRYTPENVIKKMQKNQKNTSSSSAE